VKKIPESWKTKTRETAARVRDGAREEMPRQLGRYALIGGLIALELGILAASGVPLPTLKEAAVKKIVGSLIV